MACAIDNTFLTAFDDQYALSVYAPLVFAGSAEVAADPCCAGEWGGKACSEPCAPSASWEGALISNCSSACGAYSSAALTSPGLALVSKMRWADLADDRTTNASPRSTQSPCDEPCEHESQDRRQLWADMEDSDPEEADEVRLDEQTVAADSHPDHGETLVAPEDSRQIRPSRRRARRAGGQQSQAVEEDRSPTGFSAPKGNGKAAPRTEEQHGKGASKGKGKPARTEEQHSKGANKGTTTKGVAKGDGKGKGKDSSKGVGKGASKGKGSTDAGSKGAGKGANGEKFQCQLIIGIEEDSKFRVVRRMIGCGGENMKQIAEVSGAKLRLRGRGSKFLEGPEQKESEDDLMLCISAQYKDGFEKAKKAASDLIEGIYHSYRSFCRKSGIPCPDLKLKVHEGYRSGSR